MRNDADWRPTREIEIVAGTPAGGGQDRPARALIEVLTSLKLVDQPVKLTNIPGRGGGNAWDYLRGKSGDAHVLAINSPTVISNKLLGVSAYDYAALTPLANLYTEYPIFIVRAGSPLADAAALGRRLKADIAGPRVALATAIGNTNHIALAQVVRHAGADPRALTVEVFDSARYAIAHVVEGGADLGVITAVSAVPELTSGALSALMISAPQRLDRLFATVPTLIEAGVDCKIGMWRGVVAPAGISPPATAFWHAVLAKATATEQWRAAVAEKYWANTFMTGDALATFLDEERMVMGRALGELGLLPAASTQTA
jgi:putative tricarboxylic transport membrane protein